MPKLSDDQINARLPKLQGWTRQGDALSRTFGFRSYADAVAFVVRVAFEAEANDHHPDVAWSFRKVTLNWSTHSDNGITDKDFDGAAAADRIAASTPQSTPQKS
ncbi:MAG TPA: 4a-hydroxytetrahydrobiopterin dehydratase [Vicinamibacterales bacterium]|nr:4a-hydroxytetrahydrobiopterin dehydratase [Vicinamibacterales bacterium]